MVFSVVLDHDPVSICVPMDLCACPAFTVGWKSNILFLRSVFVTNPFPV